MKVAIAGTGNVAQYLIEESLAYGHDVVVLTRSHKADLSVKQRETDYSVASLLEVLSDREALVSTVVDFEDASVGMRVHASMIDACLQSKSCKTFIPSEWTLNAEDYPEQPIFLAESNRELHGRLKQETGLRSTIICNAWFAEYVFPQNQRHLKDVGDVWPIDHASKTFTIYGPGTQRVSFASVRDVAKAVAVLLDSPEPWPLYTYLSGDQMTWNELFAALKRRDSAWTSKTKTMAESIRLITHPSTPFDAFVGYFEIESYSGALAFPQDKVEAQRDKYFKGIHFRSIEELLNASAQRPGEII